jgi:hypothetical protein
MIGADHGFIVALLIPIQTSYSLLGCAPYTESKLGLKLTKAPRHYLRTHFDSRFPHSALVLPIKRN